MTITQPKRTLKATKAILEDRAKKVGGRLLAFSKTKCVLVFDEEGKDGVKEPFSAYLYDTTAGYNTWTPGRPLLQVVRSDSSAEEFAAMAAKLAA